MMMLLLSLAAAPVAIVDARVEIGDGSVLERATIVIDQDRIVALGADVVVPTGAERIDGRGKVVTPGLLSVGEQVGLIEISLEQQTVDAQLDGVAVPAFRSIDGFNPRSMRVPIQREQGVTTQILTPWGALLRGQAFAVDMTGEAESVARARRVAMSAGFGAGTKDAVGGARGGVLLRLREIFDDVRFFKANRAAFDRAQARPLSLSRVHLEALIDVVEGKLPLLFDVHRASDISALLAFAREQQVKVMVNGGAEAWLVARELAAAKVPVMLQPSTMAPFAFEALHARDDAPALLEQAGVTVIITSGPTDNGTNRVRQEAGIAVAYGMSRPAAVRAILQEPARAFGLDGEIGTLARGKRADVVIWSGDPFELSTRAEQVFIAGKRQSLVTRQRQLADKYRR
jgi:imidazolonepropionase-like amidohydrolase